MRKELTTSVFTAQWISLHAPARKDGNELHASVFENKNADFTTQIGEEHMYHLL